MRHHGLLNVLPLLALLLPFRAPAAGGTGCVATAPSATTGRDAGKTDGSAAGTQAEAPPARGLLSSSPGYIAIGPVVAGFVDFSPADSAGLCDLLRESFAALRAIAGPAASLDTLLILRDPSRSHPEARNMSPRGCEIRLDRPRPRLDDDLDGRFNEDPCDGRDNDADLLTDEDPANDPRWDALVLAEVARAWTREVSLGGSGATSERRPLFPQWLRSGLPAAAAALAAEKMRPAGVGRCLECAGVDEITSGFDARDRHSARLLGGNDPVASRPRGENNVQDAAALVLLSALASAEVQEADAPPLQRLLEELRAELEDGPPFDSFAAIDRALSAPVDGVLPPSRWLRARALTSPVTSFGPTLALRPASAERTADPGSIEIDFHDRSPRGRTPLIPRGTLVITGADGNRLHLATGRRSVELPLLAPGAYRVDLAEAITASSRTGGIAGPTLDRALRRQSEPCPSATPDAALSRQNRITAPGTQGGTLSRQNHMTTGDSLRASTWMVVRGQANALGSGETSATVIFVDRHGAPVAVPPAGIESDAPVLARLPGAWVLALPLGLSTAPAAREIQQVSLTRDGRALASVTLVEGCHREVVARIGEGLTPIEDPTAGGVVSWSPYHPQAGDTMRVWLRLEQSALALTRGEPVAALQLRGTGTVDVAPLEPWPCEGPGAGCGAGGLWSARLRVPGVLGSASFTSAGALAPSRGPAGQGLVSLLFGADDEGHGVPAEWIGDEDDLALTYAFAPAAEAIGHAIGMMATGPDILCRLATPLVPSRLSLRLRRIGQDRWESFAGVPLVDPADSTVVRFEGALADAGSGVVCEIWLDADTAPRLLARASFGGTQIRRSFAGVPFPNPTPDGLRWPLRLSQAMRLTFEAYDVLGRRLWGPEEMQLPSGAQEIRWNGTGSDGYIANGLVLLRVRGPGLSAQRKILLLQNRP